MYALAASRSCETEGSSSNTVLLQRYDSHPARGDGKICIALRREIYFPFTHPVIVQVIFEK